ncbi:MAG: hypothetical protein JXB46_00680 [Candidatus Eisenbacteria bacterium]|nr:hypothetical protein [Candidatus Eisenbacteria bacterium]
MRHHEIALALLAVVCLSVAAAADISPHMSYQGILSDDNGNVVPDGAYTFQFSLYEQSSGGTPIWSELQMLEIEDGMINVILGQVSPLTTLMYDEPYWLGISIEGEAELTPRVELTTVPYAARAGFADQAGPDEDWVVSGDDMYSGVDGGVGVGDTEPEWFLDIYNPLAENTYMQITNNMTGDGLWSGMLAGVSGTGDAWVTHGGPGALHLGRGGSFNSLNVYSDGDMSIGLISEPQAKLDVDGTVKMTGFWMQTGAGPNYVLTSDLNGEGTWQPASSAFAASSAAGNVVLDANGEAVVPLPAAVATGGELRYQLTCIGAFAPVYVAEKARGGVFRIAGGEPGMEISWQVTAEQ